jgi:signal transduction histidine kinase
MEPEEIRAPVRGAPSARDATESRARLTGALLSVTDSRAALTAVCEETRRLVGCDRVQIWRGDLRQRTMFTPIAVGYDPIDEMRLLALRVPMNGMPLAPDFLERKYLTISHASDLHDYGEILFTSFGVRAAAFVLLERADRVLGAMQLSWCDSPTPSFPARALIEIIRDYAALAVDIHARTDEASELAETLSATAMLLASIHDPAELLETMARKITDAVGCDWGVVYLVDAPSRRLRFAAGAGASEALATVGAIDGEVGKFEQLLAASEDDLLEYADVSTVPLLGPYGLSPHVSAFINLPLRRNERLIGSLTLGYRERTGRFARRQVALAKGLAHHAVVALETARLVRSLEEASRTKSDFVAAVSHDLRTPIHILVGYADMLIEGAAGGLNPEQSDLVTVIRERALQFRDLVDGILAVARLDAQREGAPSEPIVLAELFADLARELDDRRVAGVVLEWSAPHTPVRIDAPKVRMILRNLVSNGLKFTSEGRVAFGAEIDGSTLRLRVSDTGPGIPAAERAAVFEMFQQGDAGRRAGGSGLGLGLYLVRRLAQVLGGTVELLTAEPGNTVFAVALPLPATVAAS